MPRYRPPPLQCELQQLQRLPRPREQDQDLSELEKACDVAAATLVDQVREALGAEPPLVQMHLLESLAEAFEKARRKVARFNSP